MGSEFDQAPVADLLEQGLLEIGDGYRAKNAELSSHGLPFARAGNINDGFRFDGADRVPEELAARLGGKVSEPGDVVFTSKGTVGRFAFVTAATPRFVYSPQLCYWRTRNPQRIAARYLYYWLCSPGFRRQFKAVAGQTDMAEYVSLTDQRRMKVTLPPLPEQRAIASVLGALDDKIDLNRRMCQTLEEMARALFKSWFVDFDPVRAKMEGRDPGLPKEIADLFPSRLVDSELGPIPEGWTSTSLGEVVACLETGNRPRGGVAGITAGVPSIGAESIVGLGHFDFSKTRYVPRDFYAAMKRGRLESRDVLLYKDGGRPGEFEPHVTLFGDGFPFSESCINEHVYRIRVAAPATQNYLYFWLSSDLAMAEMRMRGTGVAIPGLNSSQARALQFLLPTEAALRAFEALAEPVTSRVLAAASESRRLQDVRDTLLPKLISGEVRVPASLGSMQEVVG